MTTPPRNDAAPQGGCGAGVHNRNSHPESIAFHLPPPVRRNAPATSRIAARRAAGSAAAQRARVLAVIVAAGAHGATDAEIEAATGIRAQSVSPRRGELRKAGLIVYAGRRRLTPRGCPAMVWVAMPAATGAGGQP